MLALSNGSRRRVVGLLPNGDTGTAATIAAMQAVIDVSVADPTFISSRLVASRMSAADIYRFVESYVTFTADPPGLELLRSPVSLIQALDAAGMVGADCDDLAMLMCCLLHQSGYKPVLITVGRQSLARGGKFEHVYAGFLRYQRGGLNATNVVPMDPQERVGFGLWGRVDRLRLWAVTVGLGSRGGPGLL